MKRIDDYDMIDQDIDRSIEFARECFAADAEDIAKDERRDWSDRIRAEAESIYRKGGIEHAETIRKTSGTEKHLSGVRGT